MFDVNLHSFPYTVVKRRLHSGKVLTSGILKSEDDAEKTFCSRHRESEPKAKNRWAIPYCAKFAVPANNKGGLMVLVESD